MTDEVSGNTARVNAMSGILGIELGSTRIKLCLVAAGDPSTILATGAHEWQNQFVDGVWTYALDDVWSGL
ncbi:MAG TPA: ATPase, partial [Pseudolysinimonas sp.]